MEIRCRFILQLAALSFVAALSALAASAKEGSIKLKFKLDGEAPKPRVIAAVNPCGAPGPLLDQSIIVGKENELQNVLVYLYVASGAKAPESETALGALAKNVTTENRECQFVPRVVAMHTSQELLVGNPAAVGLTVNVDLFANGSVIRPLPPNSALVLKFAKSETRPMSMTCGGVLNGYLLIRDNPYFGVSDAKGEVTIRNIPAGKRTFTVWHERLGFVHKAVHNGQEVHWKSGCLVVDVKGDVDLGEVLIPAKSFQ